MPPSSNNVFMFILSVSGSRHRMPQTTLPEFGNTPVDYTFIEGDLAKLYCSIQNLGTRHVSIELIYVHSNLKFT